MTSCWKEYIAPETMSLQDNLMEINQSKWYSTDSRKGESAMQKLLYLFANIYAASNPAIIHVGYSIK